MDRVAVVTGANKGIGFAIVKRLCQEFEGIVYMSARNPALGQQSLNSLKSQLGDRKCKDVRYFRLDITDKSTISDLKEHLLKEHGGLDILVNNAAIAFKHDSTAPFGEQALKTNETNYFGTKNVCEILFPILKPHSRVVNVSSTAGLLKQITSQTLKAKLSLPNLTVDELDDLVNTFIKLAQNGEHTKNGYPHSAYGLSKIATTALTFIQQRAFDKDKRADLVVNACCPGYVDTDMTSHKGHLTPDEGAATPTYLALLPPNSIKPKGAFVYLKKEIDWDSGRSL